MYYEVIMKSNWGHFMVIKNFTTRIDSDTLAKLRYVAAYEGRTANSQINILIRDCINKFESEHGKIELEK